MLISEFSVIRFHNQYAQIMHVEYALWIVFTFFQKKKGQGGNDQKGHFCSTKGHFLIDKRVLSPDLAILCI